MPYKNKNSLKAIESQRNRNRRYREKNKQKVLQYQREWRQKQKDEKWSIYLLPNEMYVGQTRNIKNRMRTHINNHNNIDDYIILNTADSLESALEIEKIYHDMGFNGRHPKANI